MIFNPLRLPETFPLELVRTAAQASERWQALGFDAVKHLPLCRLEQKPPRLDREKDQYLPAAQVATISARDYAALLSELFSGTPRNFCRSIR